MIVPPIIIDMLCFFLVLTWRKSLFTLDWTLYGFQITGFEWCIEFYMNSSLLWICEGSLKKEAIAQNLTTDVFINLIIIVYVYQGIKEGKMFWSSRYCFATRDPATITENLSGSEITFFKPHLIPAAYMLTNTCYRCSISKCFHNLFQSEIYIIKQNKNCWRLIHSSNTLLCIPNWTSGSFRWGPRRCFRLYF